MTWVIVLIVVGGGIGFLLLIAMLMYNTLIGRKNAVEQGFSGIDVMLKQRHDLIPNLVSSVQAYMKHEAGVLTEIVELRSQAMRGDISNDEKVALDGKMSKAISGLMIQVENYPDLKANQNFLQLQAAMNEIEEKIGAARRSYNANVLRYNNSVEMFPTNIMAGMMRYQRKAMFEILEAERANPNVGALFNN